MLSVSIKEAMKTASGQPLSSAKCVVGFALRFEHMRQKIRSTCVTEILLCLEIQLLSSSPVEKSGCATKRAHTFCSCPKSKQIHRFRPMLIATGNAWPFQGKLFGIQLRRNRTQYRRVDDTSTKQKAIFPPAIQKNLHLLILCCGRAVFVFCMVVVFIICFLPPKSQH